jgi:hypothetical protein
MSDPLVDCLVQPALAIGFPASLGVAALFELGGCLTADDTLWELIEANWALECKSPGKLAEVQTVEIETLKLLPGHDRALFRNRAIARRNAERAKAQHTAR